MVGVTREITERWGQLSSLRPLPVIDVLLAATALELGLTMVTRNTKDFEGIGLTIVNPYDQ